jgi:hypothetical protein
MVTTYIRTTIYVKLSSIFWDIMQCSACYPLHVGFWLGLFFDSEDGGGIFLRIIGLTLKD